MKPDHRSLRASLTQLAEDFIEGLLGAVRAASFAELGELEKRSGPAVLAAPLPPRPKSVDSRSRVLAKLTAREREIFDRALHGSTNEAIARELQISIKTVETHRAKVNRKLGVRSGSELVRFGALHGLLGTKGDGVDRFPSLASVSLEPPPVLNLVDVERRTIAAALRVTGGNRKQASALLGISRWMLDTKLRESTTPLPSARDVAKRSEVVSHARRRSALRGREAVVRKIAPIDSPKLPAEWADDSHGTAITHPHELLAALDPRPADEVHDAPAALSEREPSAEPRLAVPPGEEILRSATGRVVLRRRRARVADQRSQ